MLSSLIQIQMGMLFRLELKVTFLVYHADIVDLPGSLGFLAGQLRMVFCPTMDQSSPHLAYIEMFTIQPIDPITKMYTAVKAYNDDGSRRYEIILLDSIVQPCPLSLKFAGPAVYLDNRRERINRSNCIARVDEFWINNFDSKVAYQSVF